MNEKQEKQELRNLVIDILDKIVSESIKRELTNLETNIEAQIIRKLNALDSNRG